MREINRTGNDAKPDSPIGQIVEAAQDIRHDFQTSAYDAGSIGEREVKFARISGVTYLYTRYNDQISRVAMTDV